MSDPGYRSTREAARARVEALEAELRERAANATQFPEMISAPLTATSEKIREEALAAQRRRSGCFSVLTIIAFVTLRLSGGSGGAFITLVILVVLFFFVKHRSAKERAMTRDLRAMAKTEDEKYARFRVETAPIRNRIEDEKKDRARLEQELAEARAMIEEDRNESSREKI